MGTPIWLLWLWHRTLIGVGLILVACLAFFPMWILDQITPVPDLLYLIGGIVTLFVVLAKVNFNGFVARLKERERDIKSRQHS